METEKVVSEMEELPKTIVRRVFKDKLNECSPDKTSPSTKTLFSLSPKAPVSLSTTSPPPQKFNFFLRKFDDWKHDVGVFSTKANDICKESKRQTINADDVLKAIEEIDFPEFVGPLKASLDG
ncbi:hypothetical protein Pint_19061 [Pistacia integerrima]|uniref:Uncharacterized protein n=1 Tax=Pistacia integerrima TaxID=434235 RepID=A0ACC0YZL5_9ROSI|nr:hypothetical protein Pint_19061 [Pistacia integerrima]